MDGGRLTENVPKVTEMFIFIFIFIIYFTNEVKFVTIRFQYRSYEPIFV